MRRECGVRVVRGVCLGACVCGVCVGGGGSNQIATSIGSGSHRDDQQNVRLVGVAFRDIVPRHFRGSILDFHMGSFIP